MKPLIGRFGYRPEVDGLRAIAVVAVVLFHAGLGVPGGYVGVDVFFVISGYLITSLIVKDLQEGRFTLAHFWERRARRIIPAAVVNVLVTLAAGWFLILPLDYADLAKSAEWQAIFGANFYFLHHSKNYFGGPAAEQPLLHTWSLAVEEQFYLFFPILLLGLFRFSELRRRAGLLSILGVGFMCSLSLSLYALPRNPGAAFYLLPGRAWELLCGAIVALLPVKLNSRSFGREILAWLGLVAILVPCFIYDESTQFPGAAALPPCLGAGLFLWAADFTGNGEKMIERPPTAARLLATRPVVFVGLISYSLYLWHWPLFAVSRYLALDPLSLRYRLALAGLGFILAVLSWRFVESPFRKKGLGSRRTTLFIYAGSGLAMILVLSSVVFFHTGFPARYSQAVLGYEAAKLEKRPASFIVGEMDLEDVRAGRFPRLGLPAPAPVRLLVWGDSHALTIFPALEGLAAEHNCGLLVAWHSSTAPVLGYEQREKFSLGPRAPAFAQSVVDYIRERKVPDVLLAGFWSDYLGASGSPVPAEEGGSEIRTNFSASLVQTVRELRRGGCTVWILWEVPFQKTPVPKALIDKELFGTDILGYAADRTSMEQHSKGMLRLRPQLVAAGARIIDVSPLLFDPASGCFRMEKDGAALYYDQHHLTRAGDRVVAPAFKVIFASGALDPGIGVLGAKQ